MDRTAGLLSGNKSSPQFMNRKLVWRGGTVSEKAKFAAGMGPGQNCLEIWRNSLTKAHSEEGLSREPLGREFSPKRAKRQAQPQTKPESSEFSDSVPNPGDLDPARRHLAKILGRRGGDETERGVLLMISQTWGTEEERGFALQGQPPGKGHGTSRGDGREGRLGKQLGTKVLHTNKTSPRDPQKDWVEGKKALSSRQGKDIRV